MKNLKKIINSELEETSLANAITNDIIKLIKHISEIFTFPYIVPTISKRIDERNQIRKENKYYEEQIQDYNSSNFVLKLGLPRERHTPDEMANRSKLTEKVFKFGAGAYLLSLLSANDIKYLRIALATNICSYIYEHYKKGKNLDGNKEKEK